MLYGVDNQIGDQHMDVLRGHADKHRRVDPLLQIHMVRLSEALQMEHRLLANGRGIDR